MRRAPRVDNTQKDIVAALRGVGASVTSLAGVGKGVSDLLVSYRMRWYVIEAKTRAKDGGRETLTEDECKWIQNQRAEVVVAYTPEDALRAIGALA